MLSIRTTSLVMTLIVTLAYGISGAQTTGQVAYTSDPQKVAISSISFEREPYEYQVAAKPRMLSMLQNVGMVKRDFIIGYIPRYRGGNLSPQMSATITVDATTKCSEIAILDSEDFQRHNPSVARMSQIIGKISNANILSFLDTTKASYGCKVSFAAEFPEE